MPRAERRRNWAELVQGRFDLVGAPQDRGRTPRGTGARPEACGGARARLRFRRALGLRACDRSGWARLQSFPAGSCRGPAWGLGWIFPVVAAWLFACGGRDDAISVPLFDERHAPEVVSEARSLARPPDAGPNRFVKGWLPWRRDGDLWLVPKVEARIEFGHLRQRARRLVVDGEVLAAYPGAEASLRVAGSLARAALEDRMVFDLPEAPGESVRLVGDFTFPDGVEYAVRGIALEPSLAAGEVHCEQSTCTQSGASVLEATRTLPRPHGPARLRGRFLPPEPAGRGQIFRILVMREGGAPSVLFEWESGLWNRLRGERALDLELPLSESSPWIRVRFEALGSGPAATWKDWAIARPGPHEDGLAERGDPADSLPTPPRLVLVYVMDALRADHVGHLDAEAAARRLTPTLDRLATEGLTFTRHQSLAPNTLPSTKTFFIGEPFLLQGGRKLAADGKPTLAEIYQEAGYRTALFSGNVNVSSAYGTDRGFQEVDVSVLFSADYRRTGPGYNDNAERVHRSALDWLDGLGADERAFVYLHVLHPHNPYDPPPDLEARMAGGIESTITGSTADLRAVRKRRRSATDSDRRRIAALYAAGVAYVDRELDAFLTKLFERLPRHEVLLALTSDHGEELFDHGGVLHGHTLFEEQLHIPLVLSWPGTIAPRRSAHPTDTLDLHRGLTDLVTDNGERSPFWRAALREGPNGSISRATEPHVQFAAASSLKGGIFSARSQAMKLVWAPRRGIRWGMGSGGNRDAEYVFDLENDPGESVNLAGTESFEAGWLRSRLRAWIDRGIRHEAGGEEAELDEEARSRLRALGYID